MAQEVSGMATAEESIPRSLVPYPRDDNRSRFLGLMSSGFTVREALGLIGDAKSTLSRWKKDPVFLDLFQNKMPELRKTLALEYPALEFLRNYRLVLEKDFRVIKESLAKKTRTVVVDGQHKEVPAGMGSQDFQYLLKLRAHYTPQQLQAIEQLFGRGNGGEAQVNWTDFFITMSRTAVKEEVKIGTRQRTESQLAKVADNGVADASETDNN